MSSRARTATFHLDWRKCLVVIVLSVGAVVMIVPYYWMFISSIKPLHELMAYPPSFLVAQPTIMPYVDLFQMIPMARSLFNSLFVATTVTLSNVFFCSLAGYAFAKLRFPGRDAIFLVMLSSLMIPWQVNLIPGFLIIKELGWTSTYWALIIPKLALPFGIFLCRQYIMSIPDSLIDAARIDGCNEIGIYVRVILPLIIPALATLAIFTFLAQWNDFVWPLIVILEPEMRTLPLVMNVLNGEQAGNFALNMAGAIVSTVPMILIFLALQRQFIKGVYLTGIQE